MLYSNFALVPAFPPRAQTILVGAVGLVVLLALYYQTVEKQTHLVPMPAHFQPLTFAMPEGHVGPQSALRLWIPDGNPLVQALL